jgi:hypothetical protein
MTAFDTQFGYVSAAPTIKRFDEAARQSNGQLVVVGGAFGNVLLATRFWP